VIDARVPTIRRETISRPLSSVPSQCSPEGDWCGNRMLTLFGSMGVSSGAKMATMIIASRKIADTTAILFLRNRRSAIRHIDRDASRFGAGEGAGVGAATESDAMVLSYETRIRGSR